MTISVDPGLLKILRCPRCRFELELAGGRLWCHSGNKYPSSMVFLYLCFPKRNKQLESH
jgi:hypothetical protein